MYTTKFMTKSSRKCYIEYHIFKSCAAHLWWGLCEFILRLVIFIFNLWFILTSISIILPTLLKSNRLGFIREKPFLTVCCSSTAIPNITYQKKLQKFSFSADGSCEKIMRSLLHCYIFLAPKYLVIALISGNIALNIWAHLWPQSSSNLITMRTSLCLKALWKWPQVLCSFFKGQLSVIIS